MTDHLYLAIRYLCFHWSRTLILVLCLSLSIGLPWIIFSAVRVFEEQLRARADATPLVMGAPGSRFDLVLHALTFRTEPPGLIPQALRQDEQLQERGRAVPILSNRTAQGYPVVSTEMSYFTHRELELDSGNLPLRLGDCVLGAEVARSLGLQPGDRIFSDPVHPFKMDTAQPLEMRITGILKQARSPDDDAVFTDLRTGWLIEGIGHGHNPVTDQPEALLSEEAGAGVASAALETFVRVTPENLHTFHFHGDPADFPLTALLLFPIDRRDGTLLMGHFDASDRWQIQRPSRVMEEIIALMAHIESFVRWQQAVSLVVCLLLVGLIAALTIRLRAREFETFHYLGGGWGIRLRLQFLEWCLLLALVALAILFLSVWIAPFSEQWLSVLR